MAPANPPFQIHGPPYPTDLPFYQTEALSWLLNNKNDSALAGNRFGNSANAIEAVKSLYAAGATRVDVVVAYCEPWRREREGGDYADELEVTFPAETVTRKDVLKVIRSLQP